MKRRARGSTIVESAVVTSVFLTLLCGIMQFAFMGFAYSSVCFATHRAVRYAALHGASSGHKASTTDMRNEALNYITALDPAALTVTTTWTPDQNPGSTVQVNIAYNMQPFLVNVSSGVMRMQCTSRLSVVQ